MKLCPAIIHINLIRHLIWRLAYTFVFYTTQIIRFLVTQLVTFHMVSTYGVYFTNYDHFVKEYFVTYFFLFVGRSFISLCSPFPFPFILCNGFPVPYYFCVSSFITSSFLWILWNSCYDHYFCSFSLFLLFNSNGSSQYVKYIACISCDYFWYQFSEYK